MRIECGKAGKTLIPVKDILTGGCFEIYGRIYFKSDYHLGDCMVLCVDLATGTSYQHNPTTYVKPVNAKVIIE